MKLINNYIEVEPIKEEKSEIRELAEQNEFEYFQCKQGVIRNLPSNYVGVNLSDKVWYHTANQVVLEQENKVFIKPDNLIGVI